MKDCPPAVDKPSTSGGFFFCLSDSFRGLDSVWGCVKNQIVCNAGKGV